MKKIVTIAGSLLALSAVSIAADADGVSLSPTVVDFAVSSPATPVSVSVGGASERDLQMIERDVRLVSGKIAPVRSCNAAHWPYYPADCLQRTESAGL